MRRINRTLAAGFAALSLAMSGLAFAGGDDPPGDDHGNGISRGGPGVGSSSHIGTFHGAEASTRALLAALHTRLAITTAQETAWQAFANAVTGEAADADVQNSHTAAFTTSVDAFNARATALRRQADDAAAVATAFSTLYNQLGAAQRAILDQYFAHGGPL